MKNNIAVLILLICVSTFAQNKKGKFLIPKKTTEITGVFRLSVNTNESKNENGDFSGDHKSFGFNFSPSFGYAINNNLILGLGAGYRHSYSKNYHMNNNLDSKREGNDYSIFPYIKKYFPLSRSVAFSVRAEARYTYSDYKSTDYENDSNFLTSNYDEDTDEFFVGFRPGLSLFVTKKLLLKASFGSLGYRNRKFKSYNQDSTHESRSKGFIVSFNSTQLVAGLTFLL